MNKYTIVLSFFLFVVIGIFFSACEDFDDNYSGNPSHQLSFSVDTLSFDTLFSSVGSTTRQFMVYNTHKRALNIYQIRLSAPERSGFRMNVDGRKGDRFENMEILSKDSMHIFVEVTIDPNDTDIPFVVRDSILFAVNGTMQYVLLEAYGQNVYLFKGGKTISNDTILTANRPYLLYDSLTIAPNVTVSVESGATFYMHDDAKIIVQGTLKAEGILSSPITFRGDRLDDIIEDLLPYDRTPAQWDGIVFHSESYGNQLKHVRLRNAKNGITCFEAKPDQSKLIIHDSQITNMEGNVLSAVNSQIEVVNTELSNARDTLVALKGGSYHFIHCTLANYMTLTTRRDSTFTLHLSNILSEQREMPVSATFDNCIVDGGHSPDSLKSKKGEIMFEIAETTTFDYHFNHSLLRTKEEKNNHYTNVIAIAQAPRYRLYRKTGGRNNEYEYDFRLDSINTVGVGQADRIISTLYPIDRYGVDRLASPNGPTIGAYEFVPALEEEKDK